MDDAAIHRVSRGTGGVVCSVTEDQWIATGFRPAWAKTPLAPLHYWLFWKPTRKPMTLPRLPGVSL
jgi:hypothetical protein